MAHCKTILAAKSLSDGIFKCVFKNQTPIISPIIITIIPNKICIETLLAKIDFNCSKLPVPSSKVINLCVDVVRVVLRKDKVATTPPIIL